MFCLLILFILVNLIAVSIVQAGELYRWVDKDGGVHVTDTPPDPSVCKDDVKSIRVPEVTVSQKPQIAIYGRDACGFTRQMMSVLNRAGVPYAYLDGRTEDRQARVDKFQTDPKCPVFLISLKAGGLGLNLTAADYVYLLDPWWNPAVEAQAVDRAHRIGQTRQVFTYRLISRDTVEEKIVELQARKRDLAASIVTEDNSLIRTLTRDDLALLLS